MRVLQLIDSLNPGGAETVALSYANALTQEIDKSLLCTTRKEGLLKAQLNAQVGYLYLKRNTTLDLGAIKRLVSFCKKNKVDCIHAHGSSFFIARMALFFLPKCKLIWHDHYGKSEQLDNRSSNILRRCSNKFCLIIAVNEQLQQWAKNKLKTKQVVFLRNAVPNPTLNNKPLELKGKPGKRLVHVANFRQQKDHLTLLEAFSILNQEDPDLHLHCVGMHWNDDYYQNVLLKIHAGKLNNAITLHGALNQVYPVLEQCNIGVLSSESEGLPMALLEYGMAGLAVVCTCVGQCADVVGQAGRIVPPKDAEALANAIQYFIKHPTEQQNSAKAFKIQVEESYSMQSIIPKLLAIYEDCIQTD